MHPRNVLMIFFSGRCNNHASAANSGRGGHRRVRRDSGLKLGTVIAKCASEVADDEYSR